MKDIKDKEIKIGDNIFYFKSANGRMFVEEAKVIKINKNTVRIEYQGSKKGGKKKGQQGNILNTTGKIFILENSAIENIKLRKENKFLKEEVEKIHSRFEILDL